MMAFENITVCLMGQLILFHIIFIYLRIMVDFLLCLWDMNMAFGVFTNGLPSPVHCSDLQQLDIFHNSTDIQNKLTSNLFFR